MKHCGGFSMMEVNLAVFVVGVGLLSLVALFPLGLRESDMAIVDTQQAMFADHLMSALQGNAISTTNWSGPVTCGQAPWNNGELFAKSPVGITRNIDILSSATWKDGGNGCWVLDKSEPDDAIIFPEPDAGDTKAAQRYIRFKLYLRDYGVRKSAELEVKSSKYGKFQNVQSYVTDFVFMGM